MSCSVHLKFEEKVSLTAGRHGGLQNMEVRGLIMLRITDPAVAKIEIVLDNNSSKDFQMQVSYNLKISVILHVYIKISPILVHSIKLKFISIKFLIFNFSSLN